MNAEERIDQFKQACTHGDMAEAQRLYGIAKENFQKIDMLEHGGGGAFIGALESGNEALVQWYSGECVRLDVDFCENERFNAAIQIRFERAVKNDDYRALHLLGGAAKNNVDLSTVLVGLAVDDFPPDSIEDETEFREVELIYQCWARAGNSSELLEPHSPLFRDLLDYFYQTHGREEVDGEVAADENATQRPEYVVDRSDPKAIERFDALFDLIAKDAKELGYIDSMLKAGANRYYEGFCKAVKYGDFERARHLLELAGSCQKDMLMAYYGKDTLRAEIDMERLEFIAEEASKTGALKEVISCDDFGTYSVHSNNKVGKRLVEIAASVGIIHRDIMLASSGHLLKNVVMHNWEDDQALTELFARFADANVQVSEVLEKHGPGIMKVFLSNGAVKNAVKFTKLVEGHGLPLEPLFQSFQGDCREVHLWYRARQEAFFPVHDIPPALSSAGEKLAQEFAESGLIFPVAGKDAGYHSFISFMQKMAQFNSATLDPASMIGEFGTRVQVGGKPMVKVRWEALAQATEHIDESSIREIGDTVNEIGNYVSYYILAERFRREDGDLEFLAEYTKDELNEELDKIKPAVRDALLNGKTLIQLRKVSDEWHRLRHHLLKSDEAGQSLRDYSQEGEWLPFSSQLEFPVTAKGLEQYKIVNLTNAAELDAEGRALDHCVSSYVDDCQEGYQVFSIRRKQKAQDGSEQWVSVSTMGGEVAGGTLEIDQHFGFKNRPIGEDEQKVEKWLLDEVKKGAIPINETLGRNDLMVLGGEFASRVGIKIENLTPGRIEQNFRRIAEVNKSRAYVFGRANRNQSLEDFARSIGLPLDVDETVAEGTKAGMGRA